MHDTTINSTRKLLERRNDIEAHFNSFKDKLGDLWKVVRSANGDVRKYDETSPEVEFARNLPMTLRVQFMDTFGDWANRFAVDVIGQFNYEKFDIDIDGCIRSDVGRVGDSVYINFTEIASGISVRIELTYVEIAGMIAAGYNYSIEAPLFFTVY
ncbi:hypothetical protein PARSHIK_192 [Erwinia phage vB_EamM_Parshik]|uniref:Uncharacterized protein n=1 Tax=Erwinia phage vB_EamM_Huxley TaxID=1883373 RepID=A0A1B2IDC5_9CAUD|nr:hypothetical protein BIZ81_gp092 [Erwinia phage vB_EamM_Huxley]ANZ49273.1 hypothetical protein HUXLEY_191 [Erwinia phage vB_EamM_Huxley]ANZ50101.1 hypothetical protein PARSHIK_192 [Erwinia phage vB_EamM_Parshik]